MAPLTVAANSTQAAKYKSSAHSGDNRVGTRDRGGFMRAVPFYYKNETGSTLAADSIIELCKIGAGLVLPSSTVSTTAFGASRTLDIGFQEYKATDQDSSSSTYNYEKTFASDIDALVDGLDVSSAVTNQTMGAALSDGRGVEVYGQVAILAKVIGGTLPANGVIQGVIHFVS